MKTRIVQNEPNDPNSGGASVPAPSVAVEVSERSGVAPTNGFRAFVRRRELVIFFVLCYLIGWSALPWGTFIAFAPLISAIVVVSIAEGVPGLARLGRRVIRWRVNWIWYAAAIGLPLLVHAVAIGLNMAAGAAPPSSAQFSTWYTVFVVFGLHMINPTGGPLGEEPGWRGFAQPRLQSKWSPLVSAAILGLLIAVWHLPLAFMPQFDLALPDIATTFVVTLWYAWLFNRTGGSALLTLIAHSTEGSVNTQPLWGASSWADRETWIWLISWTLLVVALLIFDRKSWRTTPEAAIDRVPDRIS